MPDGAQREHDTTTMHPTTLSAELRFEIRLLGSPEAWLDGERLRPLSYNKMWALLAYLALERGRDHSREKLADLFWSDADSATARGNLRRTLSHLRDALEVPLGAPLFSATKQTLSLLPEVRVDAVEFARLAGREAAAGDMERAVASFRGELLEGVNLPDAPEFADWLLLQREAFHWQAVALLERVASEHEHAGRVEEALRFSLRHAELDPWNEAAHRRVMRLHAARGQKGAALSQYETCCRQLKAGLGALPSEETRALAEKIRGDAVVAAPAAPVTPSTSAPAAFERRQVTVLYCELALPQGEDPDEAMLLLNGPQERCLGAIRRHAGHVVQTHGGGILAYFGFPHADEYAARHAIQAGLEAVREAGGKVDIRVGIHTGLVIAGGPSALPDMAGSTSRLATKLRLCAPPNGVAISGETYAIVDGYFDCAPRGEETLPGFERPVAVFHAQRESGAQSRVEAAPQLTPWVGRERELALLAGFWEKAVGGEGQVVLVQGEAGIGKTRLLHRFKEQLRGEPHMVRELRCFPEFNLSPFQPFVTMVETLFGLAASDSDEEKQRKVAAALAARFPALMPEVVAVVTHMLRLPPHPEFPLPDLPPRKLKEHSLTMMVAILRARAAQQPLLLVVEDLHWADPSTLELLTRLAAAVRQDPFLVLLTARPEFEPPWPEQAAVLLPLEHLAQSHMTALVRSLAPTLSPQAVGHVAAHADGIPLFAEELVKMGGAVTGLPATLLDLLTVRIDAAGRARRTAQLAATLGREFELKLLRAIAEGETAGIDGDLKVLREADLVHALDADTWQFKHALIREAAYQSQIKSDRQAAHRRVAQVLQGEFAEVAATQPELLAYHLEQAGESRAAIEQWVAAGRHASRAFADVEAAGHFGSALRLLSTLPPGPERDRAEFKTLVAYCPVLYATEGYGSRAATEINQRIGALSATVGDSPDLFEALWATGINVISAQGSRTLPPQVERLLRLAAGDPVREIAAHFLGNNAYLWLGEFALSFAHHERAAALYRPEFRPVLLERYGSDLVAFTSAVSAIGSAAQGYPARALQLCTQAMELARASAHPPSLVTALAASGAAYRWLRMPEEALPLAEEAVAVAERHEIYFWLAGARLQKGWVLIALGRQEEGFAEFEASRILMEQLAGGVTVIFLSGVIDAYMGLGMHDQALLWTEKGFAESERTGDRHFLAELHRIKGECLLAAGDAAAAETLFQEALAVSRQQQARLLELRAATSLARLWQKQGRGVEAKSLLTPIRQWFTDELPLKDLQDADRLLKLL